MAQPTQGLYAEDVRVAHRSAPIRFGLHAFQEGERLPIGKAYRRTERQLRIRPAAEEGRPSNRFVGPRFTTLIPPDEELDLEIRAPGYQLWRFRAQSSKAFRMKSGEKRTLRILLRPEPG